MTTSRKRAGAGVPQAVVSRAGAKISHLTLGDRPAMILGGDSSDCQE